MATLRALDAIFIRKGNVFEPTELARGPWDPDAQHGGAPAALITGELERIGDGRPFARIALHLLKPVPLAPLAVSATVERDGRRARRLRAELRAGDDVVCFAYALQLQGGDDPLPEIALKARKPAPPYAGSPAISPAPWRMFGGEGVEIQFVDGAFDTPGPAAAWFRLRVPVVDGEPTSQLQRAMAAADFGNGISAAISWDDYTFVNPELTVYLLREPAGEWIGLDSRTAIDPGGIGLAESTLYDEQGAFGRALQSLYVSRR
jgi:acyl-Coa thioesterase superfamily protein/acyl-CoA thioesterase superfamily protein